ncbi:MULTISPECIES: hypothetical protein [unclassified Streptomyces]|uniref:hypothetical protein n=1 Tax=unclassified Streptomyces TaxID=2593676 RepID=UPI003D7186A3
MIGSVLAHSLPANYLVAGLPFSGPCASAAALLFRLSNSPNRLYGQVSGGRLGTLLTAIGRNQPVPYDPSPLSRDAAKTLREIAQDLDSGKAEYDSPRSAARVLRDLHELADHLPQILLQTSAAVDRMARDREDATSVARDIGEAATTARNLTDQLRRAHEAAQDVRGR